MSSSAHGISRGRAQVSSTHEFALLSSSPSTSGPRCTPRCSASRRPSTTEAMFDHSSMLLTSFAV